MRFEDFISPMPADKFMLGLFGKSPVHIEAKERSNSLPLDWTRLNALLAIRSHWTESNSKLIMNSRPLFPDLYMDIDEKHDDRRPRANPAKVHTFLSMGASFVGNAIEDICPVVRAITNMLARQFAGVAGANLYCSFKDVQAFASHCDLHEVFALQCEGEKSWTIYENRAASPVQHYEGDGAQAVIDAAKGRVMMRVRMRPGDILYIPRGYYHDALASSSASLHLTFGVTPLTGLSLFGLLQQEACKEEVFRQYLPGPGDPAGLRQTLQQLSVRISELLNSERLIAELENRRGELIGSAASIDLPRLSKLNFFARSDVPAQLTSTDAGTRLQTSRGSLLLLHLAPGAEWMLDRTAFSLQELITRFPHLDAGALKDMLETLVQMGLFYPFEPQ